MTRAKRRYDIVRVDLDTGIDAIALRPGSDGVALELFRGAEPVGFVMKPCAAGAIFEAAEIARWVTEAEIPSTAPTLTDAAPDERLLSITIAICTRDHPDLLVRCLDAIDRLEPAGVALETLVIDNASAGSGTRTVVEQRPGVRYVREDRVGLNFARNRALGEAGHDILAFIDDDAVLDPGWLAGLVQAWRRAPDAGAFTGQVFPFELETEAQVVVEEMGGFKKGFQPVAYRIGTSEDPLFPVTTVYGNGCNMAYRVNLMRALGGFDTALDMGRYLPGGGDLDGLYRVVRAGHALAYEPRMLVRHQHRRDMPGLRRQIRRSWGAGTMAFLTKIRDGDPEMRRNAERFIEWWIRDLKRRVLSGHDTPAAPWRLSVHELVGAVQGLNGLYRRARRRADGIDRAARLDG